MSSGSTLNLSAVPALGQVPHNWSVRRLGHVSSTTTSNVDKLSVEGQPAVRLCNYIDVYKNSKIRATMPFMAATASNDQVRSFRLRAGDTVFTKDSETADDIGVPSYVEEEVEDLVCGYHLAIARPNTALVTPRFLYWALDSLASRRQWAALATGVTRVGLRSADIRRLAIAIPPLPVQRAIANFLDHETAKIDALVAKQRQFIETLRERRTAVVVHSALDVVEPTWVGRLGRAVRRLDRPAPSGAGVVTAYRDGEVTLRSKRREEGYTFSDAEAGYQGVEPGDLVYHGLDGFAGAVGVSDSAGKCSPVYHVCGSTDVADARFVSLILRAWGHTGFLAANAWSVRERSVDYRNWSLFSALQVSLPSRSTQVEMVRAVAHQINEIDRLVERAERFIELSKERRSALISAAVTGQVDVRSKLAPTDVPPTTVAPIKRASRRVPPPSRSGLLAAKGTDSRLGNV